MSDRYLCRSGIRFFTIINHLIINHLIKKCPNRNRQFRHHQNKKSGLSTASGGPTWTMCLILEKLSISIL